MGLNPESYFLLGDLDHALLPRSHFLFAMLEPWSLCTLSNLPALFALRFKTKLFGLAWPLFCSTGWLRT